MKSAAGSFKIIKNGSPDASGVTSSFNLEDLREQCEAHLESVRRQTRELIEEAQGESAALRAQAHEQGHAEGYEAGFRLAQGRAQSEIQAAVTVRMREQANHLEPVLRAMVAEFESARAEWCLRWEIEAIELSLAIAEKILRSHLKETPSDGARLVSEALKSFQNPLTLAIRLNPVDEEEFGDSFREIVSVMSPGQTIQFLADETISRGGCIIETLHGIIDSRIETQIERIAQELLGERLSSKRLRSRKSDLPVTDP